VPVTISSNKIKNKAQVDALREAGVITAAQAKKLLAGLKPPKAKASGSTANTAKAAAKAAIAPKGDKVPAGYIVLEKSVVDRSFLAPNKSEAGSRLHAFAKIKNSVDTFSSYLPADRELPSKHGELVKTVRDIAAGAQNYMAKQQSLVEAQHYSFPAQIWSPGDTGFHPRELEARLEKALKPFGVTLERLPNVLREAAMSISSNEAGHHNPKLRLLHAANAFERRGTDTAFQMAKSYTPVFRVEDREGSWQLKLTPAQDGMEKLEIVLRPGTKAPSASAKTPAWIADEAEKLEYGRWDPSLPPRLNLEQGQPMAPAAARAEPAEPRLPMEASRALELGRALKDIADPNRVPRNVSLKDVENAAKTLRAGAAQVARLVHGTRGDSVGWGGETVSASQLTTLADRLELLAMKMGGVPSFDRADTLKPERALAIYGDVKGIKDANLVPRQISRADVESACITIQRAAPQVRDQAASTRGSQVGWGGQLMSFNAMIDMAGELAELALKMKQAGY
jgi:hypothetical protein